MNAFEGSAEKAARVLELFHEPTRLWFEESFSKPTEAQAKAWPLLHRGESLLLLAPTGSGKTLAAFLVAIDRALFGSPEHTKRRVLYISPLKALAVDIERNLRAPLVGIQRCAERIGHGFAPVEVALRTGDTEQKERARQLRKKPDIWVTTPESLFLLLTSKARTRLAEVDVVVVDEIHALVPSKRGTHLFLSLERLEALRRALRPGVPPLQRIGLSATQSDPEEVARLLGGGEVDANGVYHNRPVAVVDAREPKRLSIRVELPWASQRLSTGTQGNMAETREDGIVSPIWRAINQRLLELISSHRSTMVFVNSRRLAERIAAELNAQSGQTIARAHHGSLSREERATIEDLLKCGTLPGVIATSSLELGIDVGAVDLVVQIEAPPSIASGLQRVGRASHQVGATSHGVLIPKHRGDLLACAAALQEMLAGRIERSKAPRNALDVLAQQVVAMLCVEPMHIDELYRRIRGAAPFAQLSRTLFEDVLDMLSGRYPSEEFSDLKPRIVWDRETGMLRAREGAFRIVINNGGVIPERGLYGVYLPDFYQEGGKENHAKLSKRVGELDEQMVFEAQEGEVFLLGASSWQIVEIRSDRVIVVPAPGKPGKMPFWHGDRPARSVEMGEAIGRLIRKIEASSDSKAHKLLIEEHMLDEEAARELVHYIREQKEATGHLPSDRTIVIECFRDEFDDVRVAILSPWGTRVHAPLATAIARMALEHRLETESFWTDDAIILRFPGSDTVPNVLRLIPSSHEIEDVIVEGLPGTALFSAHFRECAQRALLLPKKYPKQRQPFWALRQRAQALLAVASRFPSFPVVLETYREVLEDVFDVPFLRSILERIERGEIQIVWTHTERPSPFAAASLFSYAATFMYEGDAPLSERKAQLLTIDVERLRELLGEVDYTSIIDEESISALERELQGFGRKIAHPDALHDLLLRIGDLSTEEVCERMRQPEEREATAREQAESMLAHLHAERRVIPLRIAGEMRWVAVEDASRYRDALGCVLPPGLPTVFLEEVSEPLFDLALRYARTHGPFTVEAFAQRYGLGHQKALDVLENLEKRGRLLRGHFGQRSPERIEFCEQEVLKRLKRKALASLRKEIEPVSTEVFVRFGLRWHGVGPALLPLGSTENDPLLSVIQRLEGLVLPLESWLEDVLPARVDGFDVSDLDALTSSGLLIWRGFEGGTSPKIAFFTSEHYPLLAPPAIPPESDHEKKIIDVLSQRGASFFSEIQRTVGANPSDLAQALWSLVWKGLITNDTTLPLRSLQGRKPSSKSWARRNLPGTEGRWTLLPPLSEDTTARRLALARMVIERHGIFSRESASIEAPEASFARLYETLRRMEEAGQIVRGWFVAGLSPTQFAARGADNLLRGMRAEDSEEVPAVLGANDPAQPFGAVLPWPKHEGVRLQRSEGALVVLWKGKLLAWLNRNAQELTSFLENEPHRYEQEALALAKALVDLVYTGRRVSLLLREIDGKAATASPLSRVLLSFGFRPTTQGLLFRPQFDRAPHAKQHKLRPLASRVRREAVELSHDPFEAAYEDTPEEESDWES
ncbi:MAG: DEAD/DEAH box helicase [Sandaracinaceae bacterium]|nr:DEAD/DEAH box helicase [Sandaracinaceae bacterium]